MKTKTKNQRKSCHCERNDSIFKQSLKIVSIFLLLITVTACGFHLRGHTPLPKELKVLHLQSNNPYGKFTKQLRKSLLTQDVQLIDSAQQAPVTLVILNETFKQEINNISASTQVRQYLLRYSVDYQLLDAKGKSLLGPETLKSSRTLIVNTDQILSSNREQQALKEAMYQEIVQRLMMRLSSTPSVIPAKAGIQG